MELDAFIRQHNEVHADLDSDMRQMAQNLRALESSLRMTESNLQLVAQNQLRQQEMIGDLRSIFASAIRELCEAQKHTDDRLNALIRVVDDIIRHDGRGPRS